MSNAFDSTNYVEGIPDELTAGDYWRWKRTDLTDYGSGYTLTYELTLDTGGTPLTLTASLSGSEYLIEVGSATTASYTAGDYSYVALITRDSDSERIRIGYGTLTVKPDPSVSTADTRSHAKIALDAIEAVLENRASLDQESYSIGGRSLSRTSISDLREMRDYYKKEVRNEIRREKSKKGMPTGDMIKVRM